MNENTSKNKFDLSEYLHLLLTAELSEMVGWMKVPEPVPTRKDDKIRTIQIRFNKQYFRALWNKLNETEQLAVSETLHSSHRVYDIDQFEAKYNHLPALTRGRNLSLPLRFFLYKSERGWDAPFIIPDELASFLIEFVPPPPETMVATQNELPQSVDRMESTSPEETVKVDLIQRETEQAAAQDLVAVMRLIELGKISVSATTLRPTAASVKRISEQLSGGDYFEPEKKEKGGLPAVENIKAYAWPWLMQAGKLADPEGSKLTLTKAGKSAIGRAPADTLRILWQKWLNNKILDEFNRIDEIKGQFRGRGRRAMTAPAGRRKAIASALSECPVGEWIRVRNFSRFMIASAFEFEVTRQPWYLYLADSQYGRLGYVVDEWSFFQERYILCLLFEYLSTLGMVDIAYTHPHHAKLDFFDLWGTEEYSWISQYDGLEYFRLTGLGAYCLGVTKDYKLQKAVECNSITVFPDLRLRANQPLSTAEQLTLETFTSVESEGVWRLARDKIVFALESGHNIDDIRSFLTERDDQPLPETVEGLLRKIEQNVGALKVVGSAILIECKSEKVAADIASNKHTSRLCERAGKKKLVVQTKKDEAFRKAVHDLGYGMRAS